MKTNLVLIGLMGCGKTTIGKRLAAELLMPFIDMDEVIEQRYGSIKSLFAQGEEHFRAIETKIAYELSAKDGIIISTGGGVVLREENMVALKQKGLVFYLNRPVEDIIRTVDPSNRPLLQGGNEVLYKLEAERRPLYGRYCDHVIDSSDLEHAIQAIMGQWRNKGL
ncbi:MAG: shikimate kinase [Clostridia bacterium]|nr:shikimate kinase [Clostridia bacterium]